MQRESDFNLFRVVRRVEDTAVVWVSSRDTGTVGIGGSNDMHYFGHVLKLLNTI